MGARFHVMFFLLLEMPVTVAFGVGVYFFHLWILSFCCTL